MAINRLLKSSSYKEAVFSDVIIDINVLIMPCVCLCTGLLIALPLLCA
jgi:hypothetical protein